MTPSAHREHGSFLRRHAGLIILGGLGLLLAVIVVGQLLENADIETWLSEQSAGVAYLVVFLLVALDGVIPIFPGETTLSAASTLAAEGDLSLELVMFSGALGAIVGDSCLFWIARRNADRVQPNMQKAMANEKVGAAWAMLHASPGLLIVGGRYVPGMRFVVNASMGLSDIPYRRFLPWSILGGTLWSVYTCGLAYLISTRLSGYPLASIVISGVVTSIALVAIYFVYRRRQGRAGEEAPSDGVSLPDTGAPAESETS